MTKWQVKDVVPEEAFVKLSSFPRVLAAMLWRRGVQTEEAANRFLKPDWERDVHDPFLFDDMKKVVARIMDAKEKGELITIHGDYDADGISGSVILSSVFSEIGVKHDVFLPHRERDGYGMNSAAIERLAKAGTKLIVTTDCGISNAKEIARANELGVDVIITDHHEFPPELPKAYAILHPLKEGETYPFKWLTGGGVAFKLAQALWIHAELPKGHDKWLTDMAAISTVADIGKLIDENRALVKFGLKALNKTRRLGLVKLIETTWTREGEDLDAETIGFQIAPRINAAGRMDHARVAYDLLVSDDATEAEGLAAQLEAFNIARRAETDRMMKEAKKLAESQATRHGIVLIGNDDWTGSICGLVASRIAERYQRPTIVLTKGDDGIFKGSGRSAGGFHLTNALRKLDPLLMKYGGHGAACGMSISAEKVEEFAEAFRSLLDKELKAEDLIPHLEIEEVLTLDEATEKTVDMIGELAPFGEGNPKPTFLLKDVKVGMAACIGKEGAHLRMEVVDEHGHKLKLIGFRCGSRADEATPGTSLDIIVELSINEWKGYRNPQGRILDFRPSLSPVRDISEERSVGPETKSALDVRIEKQKLIS